MYSTLSVLLVLLIFFYWNKIKLYTGLRNQKIKQILTILSSETKVPNPEINPRIFQYVPYNYNSCPARTLNIFNSIDHAHAFRKMINVIFIYYG